VEHKSARLMSCFGSEARIPCCAARFRFRGIHGRFRQHRYFWSALRRIRIGFAGRSFDRHLSDSTKPENLPPAGEDRRASGRKRTLLGGVIANRAGTVTWNCSVRDISETGAQIRLASGEAETFDQTIPTDCVFINLAKATAHTATVEWRRHPTFGLKFIDSYKLDRQTDSKMQFAKGLWLARRGR